MKWFLRRRLSSLSNRKFNKVAVLMGGPSRERDVSLRSGRAVAGGLRDAGYEVAEIEVQGCQVDLPEVEAVFIALHGQFGEDGQVQGILEQNRIPYTGSGVASSRNSMDKKLSKEILLKAGIPTPAYEVLQAGSARSLELPVVVKPTSEGSSIGVHRVVSEDRWHDAVSDALQFGGEVIVEEFIPGRELTCGIVDGTAFPVIEIVAPDGWYDYGAKYTKGKTEYRVPAVLEEELAAACRRTALSAFEALGCAGLGRVDFRLSPDGKLYVLEMNTIPGFTETSLLPKAAACAGIGFSELCGIIMETAAVGK